MTFRGSSHAHPNPSPTRITAWSFSRLKTWLQCPLKAKLLFIDKLKEPESQAMADGQRIHKLAEDYLNHAFDTVPEELHSFGEDYKALRQAGGLLVEHPLAFKEDLTLCDWFAKDAWLRVRFDAFVLDKENRHACVIDLKTGKVRKEDEEQLSLFALAVFLAYPEIDEVQTELWYINHGHPAAQSYKRSHLDSLKTKWFGKAEQMLHDEQFLPTPSPLCRWCAWRKSNGGPCQYE